MGTPSRRNQVCDPRTRKAHRHLTAQVRVWSAARGLPAGYMETLVDLGFRGQLPANRTPTRAIQPRQSRSASSDHICASRSPYSAGNSHSRPHPHVFQRTIYLRVRAREDICRTLSQVASAKQTGHSVTAMACDNPKALCCLPYFIGFATGSGRPSFQLTRSAIVSKVGSTFRNSPRRRQLQAQARRNETAGAVSLPKS